MGNLENMKWNVLIESIKIWNIFHTDYSDNTTHEETYEFEFEEHFNEIILIRKLVSVFPRISQKQNCHCHRMFASQDLHFPMKVANDIFILVFIQ